MQPTLNKFHSLDYQSGGTSHPRAAVAVNRNAPLMHSVSIVVELAKEHTQAGSEMLQGSFELDNDKISHEKDLEEAPQLEGKCDEFSDASGAHRTVCGVQSAKAGDEATRQHDTGMSLDETEEEDEEEEDDGGCLSSDLARKVVIVDEADKILRSRARTAEPSIAPDGGDDPMSQVAGANLDTDSWAGATSVVSPDEPQLQQQASKVPPPIPARTTLATKRPSTAGQQCFQAGSSSTCSSMTTSSDISSDTSSPPLGSLSAAASRGAQQEASPTEFTWLQHTGGELAERGELSKLGMRRNTHHYVVSSSQPSSIVKNGANIASGMRSPHGTRQLQQQPSCQEALAASRIHHARSGSAQLERGTIAPLIHSLAAKGSLLARRAPENPAPISPKAAAAMPVYANSHYHWQQQQASQNVSNSISGNSKQQLYWPTSQQRRQSLQISLPTGLSPTSPASALVTTSSIAAGNSGCLRSNSCSQSKLLTEEELRGEREFNEQVRSAKSPDIFAATSIAGGGSCNYQQQQPGAALSGGPGRRCHSVTGTLPSRATQFAACKKFEVSSSQSTSPTIQADLGRQDQQEHPIGGANPETLFTCPTTTRGDYHQQIVPHGIVKTSHRNQLHQHQQQPQRHSQRRVSFGSIDPILVSRASEQKHTRASFAFQPSNNYYKLCGNNPPEQSDNKKPAIDDSDSNDHNSDSQVLSANKANWANNNETGTIISSHQTRSGSLLSREQKHKRHSIATNTAILGGIKHQNLQQHSADRHQFMEPAIGNVIKSYNKLAGFSEHYCPQASQQHTGLDNNPRDSKFVTAAPFSGDASAPLIRPTKLVGGLGNEDGIRMNDNSNIMAEAQDIRLSLQENSDPDEHQMESSCQMKFGENNNDDETSIVASGTNNWTVTSSTNTTTPTDGPTTKQLATGKPMKDGSRVQSIMANAKLRQEEFARLLEEHEQIVNEIHRVETKISNNSQTSLQLQSEQTTTTIAPQQQPQQQEQGQESRE